MSTDAYETINANAKVILQFASYLNNIGVQNLLVMNTHHESDMTLEEAGKVLGAAIEDITLSTFGSEPDVNDKLAAIVDGAVSFATLALFADELDEAVIPPEFIPSEEVIDAMLELFHERRKLPWLDDFVPSFGPENLAALD